MKRIPNNEILNSKNSITTIGTFDGVHLGHQKILQQVVKAAKKEKLPSVVLTFFPHPRMVLQQDTSIKLLNTIEERENLIAQQGIDYLLIKKFTKTFSELDAETFVKTILIDQLHTQKIIIGYDHHFGKNRTANIKHLKQFAKNYSFTVDEISAKEIEEITISSTKIRTALGNGNISQANAFLGYNYMLTGTVKQGKGIGRKIGFPTANIGIKETYKLIPKDGVYIVTANFKNKKIYGMLNIGTNPTISTTNLKSIEVHFLHFNQNIYHKKISIQLIQRIRDELKFNTLEELKTQLQKDKKLTEDFFNNHA